jgi:hypothetical protein
MSETPTVAVGRKRTLRERREHMWVAKLRRLPCFNQIVKKLVAGQGIAAVARWCHELNPDGELHNKTPETWRKYLTPVAMRVRDDVKSVKRFKVEPLAYTALMEELESQKVATAEADSVAETTRPIWSGVKKAARDLDAETMLKYCFLIQQRRVQAMLEFEEKINLLIPQGHKEVAVLMEIAAEVRTYEVGEQTLSGNGKVPQPAMSPVSKLENRFNALDELGKSRWRAAAVRIVDMIQRDAAECAPVPN